MKLASREAFEIRLGRDLIESEHKRRRVVGEG